MDVEIALRELDLGDGRDVFEMLQEIPPEENGFMNSANALPFEQFPGYLRKQRESSEGIHLAENRVPQTIYWLMVDGKPVGFGKLRHCLNDSLRRSGGNIGYVIRPSERGKGYGNILLKELLKAAKDRGMSEVLLTVDEHNTPSRKVIEANGGVLASLSDGACSYWVRLL
jgi:predicted acetyltransferase